MEKINKKLFYIALGLLLSFVLWTLTVSFIDVEAAGPLGSEIGLAEMNLCFHKLTGVNMSLYAITDWLGLVPLCFAGGFGIIGLKQWIERKNIFKVDYNLFVLGAFYISVMAVFAFFEVFVINYRPVLIEGVLEASYPSSTTMLALCVMLTALVQLKKYIKNNKAMRLISFAVISFTVYMVIARLISGVHWLSDIIGGILISAGLILMYYSLVNMEKKKRP